MEKDKKFLKRSIRLTNTKWITRFLLPVSLILLIPTFSFGSQELKILINGSQFDAEAKLIDNTVYVPIRDISRALGATIEWDGPNNTVSVAKSNNDSLIPEILKNVSPSVVGVIGNLKEEYSSKYKESIVHGTGVIIKPNGEILTNAHVVKDMDRIVVVLADGSGYEARLKYIDEESDLALIIIDKTDLTSAKLGKQEDIIIGKTVIAIGTPVSFSLRNSASTGIISGINRGIGSTYRLIQTDAAINPGNSGGPLVNLNGEVIGVNSSKFAGSGIEGLGFSIPVDTVNYVLKHFNDFGKVRRPSLGVSFEEDWAARVGLPSNNGLIIIMLEKNPSKQQNLKEGDVLLAINGESVNTIVDYNEVLKKYLPNDTVTLKVRKGGIVENVSATLGEK